MNKTLRSSIDNFIASSLPDIETAQSDYKVNDSNDPRFESGRTFNGDATHKTPPPNGVYLPPDSLNNAPWVKDCLPKTMPCSLDIKTMEYKNQMGWILFVDYDDSGTVYRRTISSFPVHDKKWEEVVPPPDVLEQP